MIRKESNEFSLKKKHRYEYSEKTVKPRIGRARTVKVRGARVSYFTCGWSSCPHGRVRLDENTGSEVEGSDGVPVKFFRAGTREFWVYAGKVYSAAMGDELEPDEVEALIKEKENRKRVKIARAKAVAAMADSLDGKGKREPIPRDIKVAVWQRDEGKCTQCGSNVELEFDHIVPLALGGSNTERNLQLLCAQCNREKGTSL